MFLVTDSLVNTASRHCCLISSPVLSNLRSYQISKCILRNIGRFFRTMYDNCGRQHDTSTAKHKRCVLFQQLFFDVTLIEFSNRLL